MTAQDWWVRDTGLWRSVLGTTVPLEPVLPPDPDDPFDPGLLSWLEAWNTQNYSTILAWYLDNAGLLNPSQLQSLSTGHVGSSADGQTIENRNIDYSGGLNRAITVQHNDVTVRNCKVRAEGSRNVVWVEAGVTGTVIEHCELDGSYPYYGTERADGNFGNIGIATRSETVIARYNRIYGCRQGIELNPLGVAEYNYVYDAHVNVSGVSTSSIRTQSYTRPYHGATTVRRNLVEAGTSGAITAYAYGKPVQDCLWYENLPFGVGRGFGIRGGQVENDPNRFDNSDIRIRDNRFHGTFGFPTVLGEGTNAGVHIGQPGNTFDRNRWLGSSVDLPARCGISQDACHL